jgi:gluconokinase
MEEVRATGHPYVLACSALKGAYRERLRAGDGSGETVFVLLDGSRALIAERMSQRQGHYMPLSLLDSQLALLERTPDLVVVGIEPPVREIVEGLVAVLGARDCAGAQP